MEQGICKIAVLVKVRPLAPTHSRHAASRPCAPAFGSVKNHGIKEHDKNRADAKGPNLEGSPVLHLPAPQGAVGPQEHGKQPQKNHEGKTHQAEVEGDVRIYSYGDEGEKSPHGRVKPNPHLMAGPPHIDVSASVKAGGKIALVIIRVGSLAVSKKEENRKVIGSP